MLCMKISDLVGFFDIVLIFLVQDASHDTITTYVIIMLITIKSVRSIVVQFMSCEFLLLSEYHIFDFQKMTLLGT